MRIVSVLENQKIEKRIAITPDIAKKYIALGFDVSIVENYGEHLGFKDNQYKELGVETSKNEADVLNSADIIVQLGLLSDDNLLLLKENQTLVGVLNPHINKEKLENLSKKNINIFSLEMLPRITRAQSMDILSSQANLAGYKAVIESFANFEKAIPMMMTAAGTIPAAKVLVVGAGVAGLQAIATAKRLGAIVSATDVRASSKEQVESLGGKFLVVDPEMEKDAQTAGGYAKQMSDEFIAAEMALFAEQAKEVDIIISEYQMNGFAESIDWSSNGRYLVIGSPDPRFNNAKNQAPDYLTAGAKIIKTSEEIFRTKCFNVTIRSRLLTSKIICGKTNYN